MNIFLTCKNLPLFYFIKTNFYWTLSKQEKYYNLLTLKCKVLTKHEVSMFTNFEIFLTFLADFCKKVSKIFFVTFFVIKNLFTTLGKTIMFFFNTKVGQLTKGNIFIWRSPGPCTSSVRESYIKNNPYSYTFCKYSKRYFVSNKWV